MSSVNEILQSDEPDTTDAPMSAEELEEFRRIRRDPNLVPAQRVNPVHESFGNHQLRLLGPFLGLKDPPLPEELEGLLERHPVRQARLGNALYATVLELLARYSFLCGKSWDGVAMQAAQLSNQEIDSNSKSVAPVTLVEFFG